MRKTVAKSAKSKTLSDEQLAKLKENAIGILANGRKVLLDRFPFIGSISMSLDLIPTRDLRNPTMCTDGEAIYCDIDFLSTLSNDDMIFVVGHEIYHNVMLHFLRRDDRDPKLFNYATDLETNNLLMSEGFSCPKYCLTPDKFSLKTGLSAEEYYEQLLQQAKQSKSKEDLKGEAGGDSAGESDGKSDNNKNTGNADGKIEGQFDKHIFKGEELESEEAAAGANGENEIHDSYGKVGFDPDFRPNPTESSIERIREAAITAAQNIERQGGTVPGHIKQIIDKLLAPKLNWKELLAKFVTKSNGMTRTWNRPNRRFAGRGLYLPASFGHKLKIAVGIDTSGSVYDYVSCFLSEINGIVKSFNEYEITIIQCDTEVQKVDSYSHEDPLNLETTKFEFEGFGGTVLKPIFDYVAEKQLDVDCIVVLTDGCIADRFKPTDKPEIPVLWCVTKNGSKERLIFGEVTDLDVN